MSEANKAKLILIIVTLLWASSMVCIRMTVQSYPPGGMALLRYVTASLTMLVLFLFFSSRQKPTFKELFSMLALGVLGFGIYMLMLNMGEKTVTSGIASFVVGQIPVLIVIISMLFLNERPRRIVYFGLTISVVGLFLIALGEKKCAHWDIGIFYVLIAALSGAIYSSLQKPLLKKFNAIEFTSYATWGGTLFLLFYVPSLYRAVPQVSWQSTAIVIYLGVFPSALGFLGWGYAFARMSSTQAASFLYFLPVMTIVMAWIVLGELPPWLSLLGGIISVIGAILINRAGRG